MSITYSTHWRNEQSIHNVRTHLARLGDLRVGERLIQKLSLKRQGIKWIELAQDVVHCNDFVTTKHSVL
jgi:hypothetical protein